MDLGTLVPWILTGAMSVAGYLFKGKYEQLKNTVDAFTKICKDDKVNQAEWTEFMAAAKKLLGK